VSWLWVPKTCVTWANALGIAVVRSSGSASASRSWLGRRWDDLRLMGLKLVFLVVSRVMSLLGLSRRESWWKDAEILMLRHQLAVAERERPKARARLAWPDRAWLALLARTVPAGRLAGRLAGMRLLVTPGTILRLYVPRISSTALTSTVARSGSAGDDHRSCVCGSSSSSSPN
jgi:hypothetical protein